MNTLFHHSMSIELVKYGTLHPSIEYTRLSYRDMPDFYEHDNWDLPPNLWLQDQVGFYPLFMAMGTVLEDYQMTGYQENWRSTISK